MSVYTATALKTEQGEAGDEDENREGASPIAAVTLALPLRHLRWALDSR
jgi:hypothetical protein